MGFLVQLRGIPESARTPIRGSPGCLCCSNDYIYLIYYGKLLILQKNG